MSFSDEEFIRDHTRPTRLPFLPEMELLLAEQITPLWMAVEAFYNEKDTAPPFWGFAWAGGQGLARYILDHPEQIKGKRVLDFASGSGMGAIALKQAGAARVVAADIDPLAQSAAKLNAARNDVLFEVMGGVDMEKAPKGFDLIIAGDVCYEQTMSHRVLRWLRLCAEQGIEVWLADPGRAYAPEDGLREMARYVVPTTQELEDRDARDVTVWQLLPETAL